MPMYRIELLVSADNLSVANVMAGMLIVHIQEAATTLPFSNIFGGMTVEGWAVIEQEVKDGEDTTSKDG